MASEGIHGALWLPRPGTAYFMLHVTSYKVRAMSYELQVTSYKLRVTSYELQGMTNRQDHSLIHGTCNEEKHMHETSCNNSYSVASQFSIPIKLQLQHSLMLL